MPSPDPLKFIVEDAEAVRLDLFLSRQTGQSRVFVQGQVKKGHVRVNGEVVTKASSAVRRGDCVDAVFQERVYSDLAPVEAPLEILYEDSELLVVNKAQGVVIHPAVGHRGDTLVHHLLYYLRTHPEFTATSDTRPGIVHRLDRGTSGVLVVAKNRSAQEKLSAAFKERRVKKEYECVVWGIHPPTRTYEDPIGRHRWDRKKMSSKSPAARPSKTEVRRSKEYAHFSHLAVFPYTGRTHQIRVHLSEAGYPIVGDALYETRSVQGKKRQIPAPVTEFLATATETFLHARALLFPHPVSGETIHVTAPRPAIFDALLSTLDQKDVPV